MADVDWEKLPQFPHCDAKILHAPGECEFCDRHPDWQALREVWDINFTGHHDSGKTKCPSARYRNDDGLGWGGNWPTRPQNAEWIELYPDEPPHRKDRWWRFW